VQAYLYYYIYSHFVGWVIINCGLTPRLGLLVRTNSNFEMKQEIT
jgi:hypothetical protein